MLRHTRPLICLSFLYSGQSCRRWGGGGAGLALGGGSACRLLLMTGEGWEWCERVRERFPVRRASLQSPLQPSCRVLHSILSGKRHAIIAQGWQLLSSLLSLYPS
jgi:hypothetical protein